MPAGACRRWRCCPRRRVVEARSRLNPAAGVMLSALWVASTGQLVLIIHHLAVDGVSWRILLEDLNIAWAQHRGGQQVVLPAGGTSFARWASLLAEHARRPGGRGAGAGLAAGGGGAGRAAGGATRRWIPMPRAGNLSVELDVETTRMLLGEVPAAFHAGVQRHLVDRVRVGVWRSFWAPAARRSASMWRATGATRRLAPPMLTCRARWGGSPPNIRWRWRSGGLAWAQVLAGEAALGAVIKDAKEQLRALPDGLTYGVLRYLNTDVDLAGSDPPIGFNYLGRLGAGRPRSPVICGEICQDGLSVTGAAAAIPMPLAHTVELNAGTVDTDTGPHLHADWTWAPSALDHAQVSRLSRLWFDALAGICAHVRARWGRVDALRYRCRS